MTSSGSENYIHHPRLKGFAKGFGEAHLDLACHAAFPLALTPELLYCLRENFQPQTPWIAVADILLSLCDPVGFELYEMEPEVRHQLISKLNKDKKYGKGRLYDLSDFMVAYIRQKLKNNERAGENLGAAPHWTALAYIQPKQAVNDIATALSQALAKPNPTEWVKLTSVIETYANVDPLIKCGFEPLLVLARGWDAQAQGEKEVAEEIFAQLRRQHGENLQVEQVQFQIPRPENDLQQFSFQVVTVNRRGQIIQEETKTAQYFTQSLPQNLTLEMVYIPGGKFLMGSPENEAQSDDDERPQHEVTVPPFFMGKYPITQAQWRAVAALPQVNRELKPDPSNFKGDNLPVENISWYEAVEFCDRLRIYTKKDYRLPSEAEWEYACRAGTTTPFHFGETITSDLANYSASATYGDEPKGKSVDQTSPVGSYVANAFGLYDMHGNVVEWCYDHWHENYKGALDDSSPWLNKNGENDNHSRLLRGGSWYNAPGYCRSASRVNNAPDDRLNGIGFRVVVSAARS